MCAQSCVLHTEGLEVHCMIEVVEYMSVENRQLVGAMLRDVPVDVGPIPRRIKLGLASREAAENKRARWKRSMARPEQLCFCRGWLNTVECFFC